jgi:hypothetical protein
VRKPKKKSGLSCTLPYLLILEYIRLKLWCTRDRDTSKAISPNLAARLLRNKSFHSSLQQGKHHSVKIEIERRKEKNLCSPIAVMDGIEAIC